MTIGVYCLALRFSRSDPRFAREVGTQAFALGTQVFARKVGTQAFTNKVTNKVGTQALLMADHIELSMRRGHLEINFLK